MRILNEKTDLSMMKKPVFSFRLDFCKKFGLVQDILILMTMSIFNLEIKLSSLISLMR